MDQGEERNLIHRCLRGDQQSFRQLVESHQAFAYALACRFVPREEEAEDIVQEAFVKVWKNLSRYDDHFRFKTWLGKIITNMCLDYLKSARHKKNVSADAITALPAPSLQRDGVEEGELWEVIVRLASQLTEKQKAVFILRDLQMLEPQEVSSILDMSAANLKSNLYYARLKMKEGLERFYETKKMGAI